jgi:hypothetical protein
MRTNASISLWHVGHVRSVWLQLRQAVKWPHGMQARRFSSFPQSTHGLFTDNLISSVFVWSFVVFTVIGSADGGACADVSFILGDESGTKVSTNEW